MLPILKNLIKGVAAAETINAEDPVTLRLDRVEDCLQAEVNSLDKYLSASGEKMLKEASLSSTLENKKHGKSKEDIQKQHQEEYESKALHGQFQKATEKVKGNKSWDWLKKGYLKKETESTIIAVQDQTLCK